MVSRRRPAPRRGKPGPRDRGTPGRRRALRGLIFLGALVLLAGLVLGGLRGFRGGGLPGPASDLDIPRLFVPTDLTVRDLERTPPEGVPILCYHYFRPGLTAGRVARVLGAVLFAMPTLPDKDYWTVSVPELERQMQWLHDSGYRSIGLDELSDWMEGRIPKPERAVVITIDDGDESIVRLAAPVLRRYGFHATVFMLTGRAGQENWNEVDFASWDELRALEREGLITVESHTHDMHTKVHSHGELVPRFLVAARDRNGEVSDRSDLARDLRASRAVIRAELGHDARYLAWPFGFGDAPTDSLAVQLGFRRTLTLKPVRNLRDEDLPEEDERPDGLGRYAITARTSMRAFRLMVGGPQGEGVQVARGG